MEGILRNHLQMRKLAITAGFVGQSLQKSNENRLNRTNSKDSKTIDHTKPGKPIETKQK